MPYAHHLASQQRSRKMVRVKTFDGRKLHNIETGDIALFGEANLLQG